MIDAEEIVLDNLDAKQRATIANIERDNSPKMFMEHGSILLSFVNPDTGVTAMFELHVSAEDGAYRATVFGDERDDIKVPEFDADPVVMQAFKDAVVLIGEVISRTKRN